MCFEKINQDNHCKMHQRRQIIHKRHDKSMDGDNVREGKMKIIKGHQCQAPPPHPPQKNQATTLLILPFYNDFC